MIPYIISLISGTSNIITNPIAITGSTTISTTSILNIGTYTVNYYVTDSSGNIGLNSRILNII